MIEEENPVLEEKKSNDIKKSKTIITQINKIKFYVLSPDCTRLILVDSDDKIRIFNTANQSEVGSFAEKNRKNIIMLKNYLVSPLFLTSSQDKIIRIYNS